jgi:hypothetical protein
VSLRGFLIQPVYQLFVFTFPIDVCVASRFLYSLSIIHHHLSLRMMYTLAPEPTELPPEDQQAGSNLKFPAAVPEPLVD